MTAELILGNFGFLPRLTKSLEGSCAAQTPVDLYFWIRDCHELESPVMSRAMCAIVALRI